MNSYVHQYPAALYSVVSEFGYRAEQDTGEVVRSGRLQQTEARQPRFRWLRRRTTGQSQRQPHRQPAREVSPAPAPSPHHYELKFHRSRHAGAR